MIRVLEGVYSGSQVGAIASLIYLVVFFFFFQAEDGIRDVAVTGVQTCALPIYIATVLGPRWIAAAAHNGTSSISLWVMAATFFFLPMALIINELSSRFPEEGGLYVWSKEAFGDFHGFVAGWNYWIYTVFYFPGLLLASVSMSAYVLGGKGVELSENRVYLEIGSFLLAVLWGAPE